ncbi:MAG: GNAT family N-acetyltransferase [Alphaproteobacteria bacterium]|nr:GNAT family N-acetyltransferase [Alphaproteobacteria bacterium]
MPDPAVDVAIREAAPEDGPALVAAMTAIDAETEFLGRPDEYGDWPAQAGKRLGLWRERDVGVYVLAVADGEIVGFLSAFRGGLRRAAGVVSIFKVGLRTAWRGRGIGGRLLEGAEAWARARDVHRLELRVDEENTRGLALYRRKGFQLEGSIPRSIEQDGRWCTHLWMAKPLRASADAILPDFDPPPPATGRGLDGIVFRRPRAEDAAALRTWELRLLAEAPWALQHADEVLAEEMLRKDLVRRLADPRWTMLLATTGEGAGERILGAVRAGFGEFRMRHDLDCGISVLREGWGRGIGRALASRLVRWAGENGARRLTASFVTRQNRRGVRFAERLGFQREVLMPGWAMIDGQSIDRLRLGKLMD